MVNPDLIAHYEAVTARDYQTLIADNDALFEQAQQANSRMVAPLAEYRTALAYNPDHYKPPYLPSVTPRIGLGFLETALEELGGVGALDKSINPEMHKRLIAEQLLPYLGIEPEEPVADARFITEPYVERCSDAEERYAETLIALDNPSKSERVSVYHDSAGKPLLLRKSSGPSTALTLEAINIDGMVFPAGTIVRPDLYDVTLTLTGNHRRLYTYSSGDSPMDLSVGRISAWAYPDQIDREMFAVQERLAGTGYIINPKILEAVSTFQLQDFRNAAQTVLSLCDIK